MGTPAKAARGKRFRIVQAILLVVTVLCVVFFTIPFFKLVSQTFERKELAVALHESDAEVSQLQKNAKILNAKMLMGGSDEASQDNNRKGLEEIQHKLAVAEAENQQMKQQMAMVMELVRLIKAQPSQPSSQPQAAAVSPPTQQSQSSQQAEPAKPARKEEPSKMPDTKRSEHAATAEGILEFLDKIAAAGDKTMGVLTKLAGTIVSFVTGIALAVRWVKQKPGTKTESA